MIGKLGRKHKVFLLMYFILYHIDALLHMSGRHENYEKKKKKLSVNLKDKHKITMGKKKGNRLNSRQQKYRKKIHFPLTSFLYIERGRKNNRTPAKSKAIPLDVRGNYFLRPIGKFLSMKIFFFSQLKKHDGRRIKWHYYAGGVGEKKHEFRTKLTMDKTGEEKRNGEKSVNTERANGERTKRERLIEHMEKGLLAIEYIDENNESSDVLLKVHIKSKLREYYYDLCVKEYRESKLKENKYEYCYLKDVPINNLINYIKKDDYLNIFLKHVNEDVIKVYKKMKNLHLIGSPRLMNNIDHMTISKFNDVHFIFSIDKFPKIKFNKSYIHLHMNVEIPPYEKGSTFKEFLKIIKNEKENEISIDSDENHKVEWNNDVHINILRGWVYSSNNEYYNTICHVQADVPHKCGQEAEDVKSAIYKEEKSTTKEQVNTEEFKILDNHNKINDLIDIDKDEENFINNSENYNEKNEKNNSFQNDENFFNNTNNKTDKEEWKYYDEFLKNSNFSKYFKEGYQLPKDVINMNNEVISVKENYNPLGFNESLIGVSKNEKKNITAYIPVNLFKKYFDTPTVEVSQEINQQNVPNFKEINKESISKFREIIYTEIKKLKNGSFFQKLENILKSNQDKFFDSESLESKSKSNIPEDDSQSIEQHDEREEKNEGGKSDNIERSIKNKTEEKEELTYHDMPKEEDIEYILNDNNVLYEEDEVDDKVEGEERVNGGNNVKERENVQEKEQTQQQGVVPLKQNQKNGNAVDQNEEEMFNKNFDKYLEELLKDDINALDEKLYREETHGKVEDIVRNVCDTSEYEKDENGKVDTDEDGDEIMLNDYILGKCDLIKCVLEAEILDIKIRKKKEDNINDYILKKYNKTANELYNEIEEKAMKDIQNKCVDQRRMEAYKKLMEITSLNVPVTLFRAQGKRLYNIYLKRKKMKSNENGKNEKILDFEEFITKSKKEIYDQIKFSFIVKAIFHNSKLKINFDHVIKDVLKTLIKTPTNNVHSLIKKIYTTHQAQCVLDFVSLNANISFKTNHNSSVNFSVTMKKGSHYTKEEFLNDSNELDRTKAGIQTGDLSLSPSQNPPAGNGEVDEKNATCGDILNRVDEKEKQKIFNFTEESNFVIEKKKENNEHVKLEYFTFKKGANYTKSFEEKYKKK
ncbi:hypothetical protein, conserved [Plasmodium gonderi]|uniref:Trigger factor C-terminal domain-containing protein n=1 Tax=Plasmodium gonderi TaxID=77519 RepID=A0A1Y1JSN0_PLAGO|nr:hypothetical protein, conserved [Plasmodium gonderi]GAW82964.1 hypothetical protein, conserved [Plasmodium gonderi]